MLEIGNQIKRLREQRRLTGKDLASRIGLSQSQMSRLEKGQRRVDTEILVKVAEALDVSPAVFFATQVGDVEPDSLSLKREKELAISTLHLELGKLIRSERRKRHLTSEDVARRTGHTKAYVVAVEQGRRNGLDGEFLVKACRLLTIDPFTVLGIQERIIRDLKSRVHDLDRQLAARSTGAADVGVAGTPVLIGDESPYPAEFDEHGHPMAAVEGYVILPDLADRPTFAVRVQGEEMESRSTPSFHDGDLVVFATDRIAQSGEFAFVRFRRNDTCFRRIYHDDSEIVRLQALRDEVSPILLGVDEVVSAWPLVACISIPDSH